VTIGPDGSMFYTGDWQGGINNIDLTKLSCGLYIVSVNADGVNYSSQTLKQ
jgi:hypothetical protein